MRRFLIPVLFVGLVAGCSAPKIGPHRIDVQQGNALNQENVSRLKPGLNRAQVRFLLGTPLVVDPFRTDRWDYVYLHYKAGKLAEQRRITLFFEGDTLARIEGDLPDSLLKGAIEPPPAGQAETPSRPVPPLPPPAKPLGGAAPASSAAPAETATVAAARQAERAPARMQAEPSRRMAMDTEVERIRPDVMPTFPEPASAPVQGDAAVLKAVEAWAKAWAARDETTYLAAYDETFVPAGGIRRADWEKQRRLLLGRAASIEVRVESPTVERNADGSASVTFNQFYRSDSFRDAVVKRLRLIEREGDWRIVEERVLSVLRGARP